MTYHRFTGKTALQIGLGQQKVPSFCIHKNLGRIIFAVPPILASKETHLSHILSYVSHFNRCDTRQLLLFTFRAALKSPFNKYLYIAITPPATLFYIEESAYYSLSKVLFLLRVSLYYFFELVNI